MADSQLDTSLLRLEKRCDILPGNLRRVLWYYLCEDVSSSGESFLYVKCHETLARGGRVLRERFDLSGNMGMTKRAALTLFGELVRCSDPVSPVHIADIIRDEALRQRNRSTLSVVASNPARMSG